MTVGRSAVCAAAGMLRTIDPLVGAIAAETTPRAMVLRLEITVLSASSSTNLPTGTLVTARPRASMIQWLCLQVLQY